MRKIKYISNVIVFFVILTVIHGICRSFSCTVVPSEHEQINTISILGIRILTAMWMSATFPLFKTKKKGDII